MNNIVSMSKVVKDNKNYYNFFLFGVLITNVFQQDYQKLYYSVREYCRANDIPVNEVIKEVTDGDIKNETKSKSK